MTVRAWILAFAVILFTYTEVFADDGLPHAFSGDINDFMNNKVPDLSRRKVGADLTRKWNDFFLAVLIEAGGIAAKLAEDRPKLDALSNPDKAEPIAAVQALEIIDEALSWNRGAVIRIERLRAAVENAQTVCADHRIHDSGPIADLGLESVLGGLIPGRPQLLLAWDPTWWSTVIAVVYDVIVPGFWYEDERKKAESALGQYPIKVMQRPAIAALSLSLCQSALLRADQALKTAASDLSDMEASLADDANLIASIRASYEAVIVTSGYNDRLRIDGLLRSVTESDRKELTAGLGERLDYTVNALQLIESAASNKTCPKRAEDEDYLSSVAAGTKLQVDTYVRIVGTATRLEQASNELGLIKARADAWLEARRSKPC